MLARSVRHSEPACEYSLLVLASAACSPCFRDVQTMPSLRLRRSSSATGPIISRHRFGVQRIIRKVAHLDDGMSCPNSHERVKIARSAMVRQVTPRIAPFRAKNSEMSGQRVFTIAPGTAFFDHYNSFAMMRGGHLDITVLGAYQVAENGDLANWATDDESFPPAVGGAMDLVVCVPTIFITMRHVGRKGEPKLLERCTYPLTDMGVVSRVYTDLAVLDITREGFRSVELAPGNDFDTVQRLTGARILT